MRTLLAWPAVEMYAWALLTFAVWGTRASLPVSVLGLYRLWKII